MKILFAVSFVGICLLSRLCFAEESITKISSRITFNLSLLPQETNLPTFDAGNPISGPKPGFELMIQTLGGGHSISSDARAPVFVRVNPSGVSIRFEWSFK